MSYDIDAALESYYQTRKRRLELQHQSRVLEAKEQLILDGLIPHIYTGVHGAWLVEVEKITVPKVDDWAKFNVYVLANDSLDMYQHRITPSAVMARLNDGKQIEGVSTDEKTKVKVEYHGQ